MSNTTTTKGRYTMTEGPRWTMQVPAIDSRWRTARNASMAILDKFGAGAEGVFITRHGERHPMVVDLIGWTYGVDQMARRAYAKARAK